MQPVGVFHIGPQKTGTSWVYRCLREHPEIGAPTTDAIHYFDMLYFRGRDWYASYFPALQGHQIAFDPTPTYIRSQLAPSRIRSENSDAKIIVCLRNPIERAFSHYWHEKKKNKIRFDFSDVLRNYDMFNSWVEPGFYAQHMSNYLAHFSRSQIFCQRFEHLVESPADFLRDIYSFLDIDPNFIPSPISQKVNAAGPRGRWLGRTVRRARLATGNGRARRTSRRSFSPIVWSAERTGTGLTRIESYLRREYDRGVPKSVKEELLKIFEPEIEKTESLLNIDLSDWKEPY